MIDALAILIDQGCIDPTKYIEMECGIQHRCKDELFSSLMRSLNASQTSLYGCLSYLCSFTIKMHSYLYSSALRCSEIYKKCKKYKKKAKGTRLFTGPGCYGSAYREHNRWESLWVIALVALGNAKREGHRAGPKHAHLCSVFRFRGRLSCVCADTGIFTLAKQGSCIDLCDCDEFGIVI